MMENCARCNAVTHFIPGIPAALNTGDARFSALVDAMFDVMHQRIKSGLGDIRITLQIGRRVEKATSPQCGELISAEQKRRHEPSPAGGANSQDLMNVCKPLQFSISLPGEDLLISHHGTY